MDDERRGHRCCVCGRGFNAKEWEYRHNVHEQYCLRFKLPEEFGGCSCNLVAHAKHCPVCEPDKAQQFGMRAEAKDGR